MQQTVLRPRVRQPGREVSGWVSIGGPRISPPRDRAARSSSAIGSMRAPSCLRGCRGQGAGALAITRGLAEGA